MERPPGPRAPASSDPELEEAVHAALAGHPYLNPRLGARVATDPEATTGGVDGLSDRELEVLRLLALGGAGGYAARSVTSTDGTRARRCDALGREGTDSRAGCLAR